MVNPTSMGNRYLAPWGSVWQVTLSCHFLSLPGPSVQPDLSARSSTLSAASRVYGGGMGGLARGCASTLSNTIAFKGGQGARAQLLRWYCHIGRSWRK